MKIVDSNNLPLIVLEAIKNDPYDRGHCDYSVTQLIGPARKSALIKKHNDEIVIEAISRAWALLGQALHVILERAAKHAKIQVITELRLYMNVGGKRISGSVDLFLPTLGALQDYKTTTAYTVKKALKKDWEAQLNCYAELLRVNGHEVKSLEIVPFVRDWLLRLAEDPLELKKGYPAKQIVTIPVTLWPREKTQAFLAERVKAHEDAKKTLPECTAEERWAEEMWRVEKRGAKKSIKNYKLEDYGEQAETLAKEHAARVGAEATYSSGEANRCTHYCEAAQVCDQYKAMTKLILGPKSGGADVHTLRTAQ